MYAMILAGALVGLAAGLLLGQWVGKHPLKVPLLGKPAVIVLLCATIGGAAGLLWSRTGEAENVEEVGSRFEEAVLKSPRPVLVDFYATWCIPCKRLAPTIAKLAREYAGRVDVVKVDGDLSPHLMTRYEVRFYPTVVLFVAGVPQKPYFVGGHEATEYRAAMDDALRMQTATAGSQPSGSP